MVKRDAIASKHAEGTEKYEHVTTNTTAKTSVEFKRKKNALSIFSFHDGYF
ncbi:MAG: hypothetical protein ACP5HX_09075 [Thermoproteota archaeon]